MMIEKAVFDKEISMCRDLNSKNGGKCNWGECEKCGVIPLLYKLGVGEIHENADDVYNLKRIVLN